MLGVCLYFVGKGGSTSVVAKFKQPRQKVFENLSQEINLFFLLRQKKMKILDEKKNLESIRFQWNENISKTKNK